MRHPRLASASLAAVALITAVCGGCSTIRKPSSASPPSAAVANVPASSTASASSAAYSASPSATASPSASASSSVSAFASASTSASPSAGDSASAGVSGSGTVIALAPTDNLGRILVDSQGMTVYLFEKDTSTASTCYNACALAWPPVTTTGAPVAAHGTDDGLLGTATRADGRTQVLYNGHPLYYFSGDTSRGDTNGEGSTAFGATWYVGNDKGHEITD